jgi:uncharacterized protein
MTDKAYIVRLKQPEISAPRMASVEVYGDQLIYMNADQKPVAIFLLETVESWTVTDLSKCAPEGLSEVVELRGGAAQLPTASMEID